MCISPAYLCKAPAVCENRGMTVHTHVATLHTNHGAIKLNLFGTHTPITVANFVELADGTRTGKPFYDGVIFHRIIDGFMIQGGDPTGTGMGGPGYQFGDEPHPELTFKDPYKLAMANAGPDTNGSQFFVMLADVPLPPNYTIFGQVTKGMDVVDAIKVGDVMTNVMVEARSK